MVIQLQQNLSTAKRPEWVVGPENEPGDGPGIKREVPTLTIVVPTRNEAGNVDVLVERLERAWPGEQIEIVFVDDSDDNTPDVVNAIAQTSASQVRLIHRAPGERSEGLGGAVLEGLRAARAGWVCVMDADLQHPPELVPTLYQRAQAENADLVIASRYSDAGSVGEFNALREAISHFSTTVARVLFPARLGGVSDPMSGFFLVRKGALDLKSLRPRGFKILLEILVRTPGLKVSEVGFAFGERHAGQSKANLREGMRYLSHLVHLRLGEDMVRFLQFLVVGLSGLAVNSLALAVATEVIGLHYLVSLVVATECSTLWNFGLSEAWVFNYADMKQGRLRRFLMFFVMNNAALALRGPIVYVLTSLVGVHYLLSNLISLVALTILRYTVADALIWGRPGTGQHAGRSYNYNIHDIVSVTSQVALPELERFMIAEAIDNPTIRVQTGDVLRARQQHANEDEGRHIFYDEGFGPIGFGIDVLLGDTIEVVASPLLRHSPHVLYTNVVEPILRWTFVKKGYALIHGACIAFGDKGYLVTARTDTGKTTTILRMLSQQTAAGGSAMAFVSDDLTLLSPDGRVMTYPKPLTISHHTLKAVNAKALRPRERLALLVQSRIHSREGRRFAFQMSQTTLPVATINTFAQWFVPPPKYHVQRLIPGVQSAHEAKLAGMFVIERTTGDVAEMTLAEPEALEIIMRNCEDAYGFPPYHTIAGYLYCSEGNDLRLMERQIVDQALAGHRTALIRRSNMDWAERIQALVSNPVPASMTPGADGAAGAIA